MNVGRGRGRLAPVPSIRRVMDINRVLYPRRPSGKPRGREMLLHYRRGTFRTYRHIRYIKKQGKQGAVKSAIVGPTRTNSRQCRCINCAIFDLGGFFFPDYALPSVTERLVAGQGFCVVS